MFFQENYKDTLMECFDFCIKKKGIILYRYVIISNHIHMIIQSSDGKLLYLISDFIKFTAKTILDKIQTGPESRRELMLERFKLVAETYSRNKNYQFWQMGNMQKKFIQKSLCGQR